MSRPITELSDNVRGCRPGERYGLEVEAEGYQGGLWSEQFLKYWRSAPDGSLRNGGIEFISVPLIRSAVPPAIAAVWPYLEEGLVRPSVRTGIHIHVSCLGLSTDDVLRILTHYALLEPVLFNFVGEEREENIYCVPWYRAHDEPATIRGWLDGAFPIRRRPCKYSALFVGPLTSFGTIEFRHAPTWTDRSRMLLWWQMIQMIYRTHRTTYDVLAQWEALGPEAFTRAVFGKLAVPMPPLNVFEQADVTSVAEYLVEAATPVSPFWGAPPELATRGTVVPNVAPQLRARNDDRNVGRTVTREAMRNVLYTPGYLASDAWRGAPIMREVLIPQTADTLTVNVDTLFPADQPPEYEAGQRDFDPPELWDDANPDEYDFTDEQEDE